MPEGMKKREVLQSINFGHRIAEDELVELESYFVETDHWKRIFSGDVDIVYGAKGAGKSAIYSLLLQRSQALQERNILIIAAENPRGATVFKDLVSDPPTSEDEFRNLWKLYFLSLVGQVLQENNIAPDIAHKVVESLQEAGLMSEAKSPLAKLLRSVVDYVRNMMKAESMEGGVTIDPATGQPSGVTGKITFREPNTSQRKSGLISTNSLLELADEALASQNLQIWIVIDRLDVAFAESEDLEVNALRALFRAYRDMSGLNHISLKIFLRTDIWQRITKQGFREASHITRHITISWDKDTLLNLVIRRALKNEPLRVFFEVDPESVLQNSQEQANLFYRIFPQQVNVGLKQSMTFEWMLSRTRDATRETAPRELIHLLASARDVQLRRLEIGADREPQDEALFDSTSIREALPEVSKVRLEQTLYAENPNLREWLQKLEGEKTQQTPRTLASIWGVEPHDALGIVGRLAEVGFFERRRTKDEPTLFWVPFLYREALNMVQGSAVPGQEDNDDEDDVVV